MSDRSPLGFAEIAMLLRMESKGGHHLDIHDITTSDLIFTAGHQKWGQAQIIHAFLVTLSLMQRNLLEWQGESRALGKRGWHGGLWSLTPEGALKAVELREASKALMRAAGFPE